MRKTREVLRLKFEVGLSHREVATSLGLSPGTVGKTLSRLEASGLTWGAAQALSEEALEAKLYAAATAAPTRPLPDYSRVHAEYRRVRVTLELLHRAYLDDQPDGYGYTQFCEFYRRWLGQRGLTMRQEHKAGEKLFVDYSGKRPHYIDREAGERVDVELFTAVLGASNYVYTEATRSQQLPDWIASHVRAFAFLGGVPRAVVPDQLKSAGTTTCRYEPEINRNYAEMALHYDVAIMPARPGRPKDKARVEGTVLMVQRWVLARLRNQRFFSLIELNGRIAELNDELNGRVTRKYGYSRRQRFEQVERAALRPLPVEPFEFAEFKKAKGRIDYHIELDRHYYSVPYRLVGELVELRHTNTQLANAILTERRHPEQGYRSCLGILRLGKKYSPERLECACARAHAAGARSYRSVSSILEKGLDQLPRTAAPPTPSSGFDDHENVRGQSHYQ